MSGKRARRPGMVEKNGQLHRSKWTKSQPVVAVDQCSDKSHTQADLKLLTRGFPIYIPDPVERWTKAVVIRTDEHHVLVERLTGEVLQVNPNDVMLRSTESNLVEVVNLTQVIPVNEATVLDCLHQRFALDRFYTQAGSTIVAVNPCKNVEYFYTLPTIRQYHTQATDLPPHIYQLAALGYCALVRGLGKVNQSLVVSGESGAGKTVSAKHLLRYLTIVSSPEQKSNNSIAGREVERRVLESNPILEAFGNAATSRNENSSRFGKFIQLQFNRIGRIQGGIVETYLLEKTRVIHPGQANFHIFYQLSGIRNEEDVPSWLDGVRQEVIGASSICLTPNTEEAPDSSGCETPQTSSITKTVRSMEDIGISPQDQVSIFQILLAILHLSQIKFQISRDSDKCYFEDSHDSNWSMSEACRLLGISNMNLEMVLLNRRIVSGNNARRSVFIKSVGEKEARSRRDCLAMLIYARLFDWIVRFINTQIRSINFDYIINLLDIYGFESLGYNSLEQLCINYANERLQQHYVTGCLRDMQIEHAAEKIPWVNIDYHDNRPCVEALHAPSSVFGVLNEEVCLNRLSEDKDLCDRVIDSDLTKTLVSRNVGAPCCHFVVNHYAGPVTYTVEGVVDKNRDAIPPELVELLNASDNRFLAGLLTEDALSIAENSNNPKTMKKKTVLTKFKSSLDNLMASISETDVHYVRCVKPNARNTANRFDRPFVLQQLKACGTIETVDICCHGYPTRMKYSEFAQRYQVLAKLSENHSVLADRHPNAKQSHDEVVNARFFREVEDHIRLLHQKCEEELEISVTGQVHAAKSCAIILASTFSQDQQKSLLRQFGIYKLFLTQPQLETLEKCRESCIATVATLLQTAWRAKCQRCEFRATKIAAVIIQRQWRTYCQYQHFQAILNAVLVIQTQWRMYRQRIHFHVMKRAVHVIETQWLMYRQRSHFCAMKTAAVIIQSHWRAYCQRRSYSVIRSSAVIIQKEWRAFHVKRQFSSVQSSALIIQKVWRGRQDRLRFAKLRSKVKDKPDCSEINSSNSFNILNFDHHFKVGIDIADNSDNESCMSDDSGVMVKSDGRCGANKDGGQRPGMETLVTTGMKTLRMGDGVITCRQLTKPGFRFHVRPNRLLPFAEKAHASSLPQGLLDALTWEARGSTYGWTHAMTDTLIGIKGWNRCHYDS